MRLFAFGDVAWGVILVPALLLAEVVFFRKWCSKFCPISALMSLVGKANRTFVPAIDNAKCRESAQGTSCEACAAVCPRASTCGIPRPASSFSECTKCRACVEACPTPCHHHAVSAEEGGAFHRHRGGRRDRAGSLGQARSRRHPSCDASGARVSATPRPGKIALRGLSPSDLPPGAG